jgi:predicted acylesterase/phospholipase RssA
MKNQRAKALCTSLVMAAMAGCADLPRNPVPVQTMDRAEVAGMPGVRAWGGQFSADFQADLATSIKQEVAGVFPLDASGYPIYNGLALSGGGSNGAFGAGLLNGWTQAGTRPVFKVVTGISTGALIAPFAFLGPEYDEQLRDVYTTTRTYNIAKRLNILSILFTSESFARVTPLKQLVEQYFDAQFLKAVAAAHNRGRRLYVGTTHMDAQRLVVWNMGAIANSAHPDALELFHKVVVASSSIPTVFPPVFIGVEVDGQSFDEMHTDGGTITQMFFFADTVDLSAAARAGGHSTREGYRGTMYVIRNGKLGPEPEAVKRRIAAIASRSLSTMIKYAAFNDLMRIHRATQEGSLGFRYAAIPDEFESNATEPFDPDEMARLFDLGYRMGLAGTAWQDTPPRYLLDQ